MKAVICPVCNGDGKKRAPTMPNIELIQCHGCDGRGWVELHEDYVSVPSVWIDPINWESTVTITDANGWTYYNLR